MMKKLIIPFLGILLTILSYSLALKAQKSSSVKPQKIRMIATYDAPAKLWESEALPIGNGYMGAMIFGGVYHDVIQTNEHTLWSGGPGENPSYNGGHLRTPQQNKENLQKARTALQKKMNDFTKNDKAYLDANGKLITKDYGDERKDGVRALIEALMGSKDNFGSYQTLGNVEISYNSMVMPEVVKIETDCDNKKNPSQSVDRLFDGDMNTKWFADGGPDKGFPCYITWEYRTNLDVKSYTIVSGNDAPERDPNSWRLYGYDGKNYTLIDEQTDVVFSKRKEIKKFSLKKAVNYKTFKIEILGVAANNKNTPPQLAGIDFEYAQLSKPLAPFTAYKRVLDIDNATHTVSYKEDGVNYMREYFMSYPDNVMVMRLKASQNGKISRTFTITSPQKKKAITVSGNTLTMTGQPAGQGENGLKFAQQVKVLNTGGKISTKDGNKIIVENANEVIILMSAATNYHQSMDNSFNYFSETDPLLVVKQRLAIAEKKSYDQLLLTHQKDYKGLYDKMSLNLGNVKSVPEKTTDKLLTDLYKSNTVAENLFTEMLYYQFGRYLLISSSRKNSLPANLQGVWADKLANPWNADYHTNINVQMNYWPTQTTNLSECHAPIVDYINSLVPRGEVTAKHYYGTDVRGWATHHENNIWGNTAPAAYYSAFHFPAGAGWMCQDIWEYYQFNDDKKFLEKNYNTLLGAALFWVDNLWTDERDGKLVANPSYSPEHGEYSLGASCDQAIITEMFDIVIKASQVLGKNTKEVTEIKNAKSKLSGPQIGLGGQFMEWKDEVTKDVTGDGKHRHVNQLFWLHPGSQIVAGRSTQEDKYVDAMKKTLETRGDGGTGWSKAWKINFWARLRDGNRAHKLLMEALALTYPGNPANTGGVYQNLFDTHPPFQIDGNFGATAGIAEMLLQSQGGYIELLPALPDAWEEGSFNGLKARGNFEINVKWNNAGLISAEVISNSGKECIIKYPNAKDWVIKTSKGALVTKKVIDQNKISFTTSPGAVFYIKKL
ncbi:MAG: glycoside hydrolase family 95 protein [Pedobacter sp.]|uniref:glycoside hydrolase family 95 protein n=1 Tax=Pedobacter sp. TaxID=1411316 RepID=UPI00356AE01E